MMRTLIVSSTIDSKHISAGTRTKLETPRGKYLSVTTELVCDIPTNCNQNTVLLGLMVSLLGGRRDLVVDNKGYLKRLGDVLYGCDS